MSSSHQDDVYGFLLWAIAILAAIAAAVWLGYWIVFSVLWSVPYALFLLIPWGLVTLTVGYGLLAVCSSQPSASEVEKAKNPYSTAFYGDTSDRAALERWRSDRQFNEAPGKLTPRTFYPRRLIIALPALTFLALVTVQIPIEHTTVTEKVIVEPEKRVRVGEDENIWDGNGNHPPIYKKKPAVTREETRVVLQWPWLYEKFNQVNSGWQGLFSPTYLLQGKPYEPVLFDRNYVSIAVWFALLLTGPMLFWTVSESRESKEDRDRVRDVEDATRKERSLWESRQQSWREQEEKYTESLKQWSEAFEKQKTQLETYKAREEHLVKPALRVELEKQKPGLLDSDVL